METAAQRVVVLAKPAEGPSLLGGVLGQPARRPGAGTQPAFRSGEPQLQPPFPFHRRRQLGPQHPDFGVLRLHHRPQPGQQLTLLPGTARQIGLIGHKPQACSTCTATSSTRYGASRGTVTPWLGAGPLNGHSASGPSGGISETRGSPTSAFIGPDHRCRVYVCCVYERQRIHNGLLVPSADSRHPLTKDGQPSVIAAVFGKHISRLPP